MYLDPSPGYVLLQNLMNTPYEPRRSVCLTHLSRRRLYATSASKSTTTSMQGPMMVEEGEIVDHSGIL